MTGPVQTPSVDTVTPQLVRWCHGLELDDVPPSILERMRYLILDGISCALVASHLPWSETAAKTVISFEPEGSCSVWGYTEVRRRSPNAICSLTNISPVQKLRPLAAAILNSSFVQGFEIDDWHRDRKSVV